MMNSSLEPEKVLKYHGKTFYFAQRFLGRKNGYGVARLYRFCRYVDDLADETPDKDIAHEKLQNVRKQLIDNDPKDLFVEDFLNLSTEWQINTTYAIDLIDGAISDLGSVELSDESELLQYCYRVAGTVGLMMCPLLDAQKSGQKFALDLGIAMQLTNIARDVLHDAKLNRRYIPAHWIQGFSAARICKATENDRAIVQRSILRLTQLADIYYESAHKGYVHLPIRSRVSIAIAACTYRQIGVNLLKNGCNFWEGRTFTTLFEKVLLAIGEIGRTFVCAPLLKEEKHNSELHQEIIQLYNPGSTDE